MAPIEGNLHENILQIALEKVDNIDTIQKKLHFKYDFDTNVISIVYNLHMIEDIKLIHENYKDFLIENYDKIFNGNRLYDVVKKIAYYSDCFSHDHVKFLYNQTTYIGEILCQHISYTTHVFNDSVLGEYIGSAVTFDTDRPDLVKIFLLNQNNDLVGSCVGEDMVVYEI